MVFTIRGCVLAQEQSPLFLLAPFAFGVSSHLLIFRHGEYHMKVLQILGLHLVVLFLLHGVVSRYLFTTENPLNCAPIFTAILSAIYIVSLAMSIIIYRICFHRLYLFPGPLFAKVSKLWHVAKVTKESNHLLLHRLYNEYGDFVRTGPNEITTFAPEAILAMDGPGNRCLKGDWYDSFQPYLSIETVRNKKVHDQRRKAWDRGFSMRALRDYENYILKYAHQLEQHISSTNGATIDATKWFFFFSFDVMGDLALGKSFHMLKSKKLHDIPRLIKGTMRPLGILAPAPWLGRVLTSIPFATADLNFMFSWCWARMQERMNTTVEKPDVSSWLIESSKRNNDPKAEKLWLIGDSLIMIIAGSDTVATTLVYAFYQLALSSTRAARLYEELKDLEDISDFRSLQSLEYLNGFISETLRLYPPIPTGGMRQTPPEGLYIRDQFIPGNITLVASRYTIGRLESCYEQADKFIPERWFSKPEMIKNRDAYAPFSTGAFGCVGKNLALMEIRHVLAALVLKYHISFAPGETGAGVVENMQDHFTVSTTKLELIFKPR